jgi:hypothetical protein
MKRFGLNSGYIGVDRRRDEAGIAPLQKAYLERIRGGANYLPPFLDPDALVFLQAAGIVDGTIITAVDTLVRDLKGYGIWTKLKAIYPFVGGTATTHKFNLKNPADTDAAFRLLFVGGWTHSATGAFPNGANAYANTFYTPNIEANPSNNSVSFYSRTNSSAGQPYDISSTTDTGGNLNPYSLITKYSNNQSFFANGVYNLSVGIIDGQGFFLGFIDATNQRLYRSGVQIASTSIPASSLPGFSLYIGANNGGGVAGLFSNKQCAFASMGGSKLTTTEATNYYTAVQAFQTTLGRQV